MNHCINLKRIVFIHLMALPVAEIAHLWSFTFSLLFLFQLPFYRTVSSTQPPCFTVINMVDVVMLSNWIVCGFPTCTKHMLVSKQLGAWIKHTKLNRLWASTIPLIFDSNDQDPVCEIQSSSKVLVHVFQLPCESFIMGCQLFWLKLEIIICLIKSVRWVFFPILLNWQLWNQLIFSVLRCWLPACHAFEFCCQQGGGGLELQWFFFFPPQQQIPVYYVFV